MTMTMTLYSPHYQGHWDFSVSRLVVSAQTKQTAYSQLPSVLSCTGILCSSNLLQGHI